METQILLDVRGLEPPEPLEIVLDALPRLAQNAQLCMLIDREPHPLYHILERNGFCRQTRVLPDFSYEVTIWHQQ